MSDINPVPTASIRAAVGGRRARSGAGRGRVPLAHEPDTGSNVSSGRGARGGRVARGIRGRLGAVPEQGFNASVNAASGVFDAVSNASERGTRGRALNRAAGRGRRARGGARSSRSTAPGQELNATVNGASDQPLSRAVLDGDHDTVSGTRGRVSTRAAGRGRAARNGSRRGRNAAPEQELSATVSGAPLDQALVNAVSNASRARPVARVRPYRQAARIRALPYEGTNTTAARGVVTGARGRSARRTARGRRAALSGTSGEPGATPSQELNTTVRGARRGRRGRGARGRSAARGGHAASTGAAVNVEESRFPPKVEDTECPICLDEANDLVTTTCGHIFCEYCITLALQIRNDCPMCRKVLTVRDIRRMV